MNRKENLAQLKSQDFDVCVIGGGASGLGCALDAALRGMKVCLIERDDFAAGTSSRSTKLIHGGVRYLEQAFKKLDFGQLRQVRHGLAERHILLNNAPHLAHPLALVTPVFNWFEAFYFSVGLKLYSFFAVNDSLPQANWLNKKNTFLRIPTLTKKLHSSVMYYDGQLDDARYCIALAQTANLAGVVVANHLGLNAFQKDASGKLTQAVVKDELSKETFAIKAKVFINCTGPYADTVRTMANPAAEHRLKPSKGVHIIVPKSVLNSESAMLIPKTSDGRVVFVIPFENEVMIGTTDDACQDIAPEPILEKAEIDFLIETTNRFLDKAITADQVKAGFGGLRPLVSAAASPTKATKQLLRDHEVEHDDTSNLVSLMGGKWTTYRLMAKDTIDYVATMLSNQQPCQTESAKLLGAENYRFEDWENLAAATKLDADICQHLTKKYGCEVAKIKAILLENANFGQRLVADYPFIEAEVLLHCRQEMACSPRDVLARRIRLELIDWKATLTALPRVCELMQTELGWTAEEKTKQETDYQQQLTHFIKTAQMQ